MRRALLAGGMTVETPLVVPSFSSKGYPRAPDGSVLLSREAEAVLPLIPRAVLVSAYDLYYDLLPERSGLAQHPAASPYDRAEIIFIDSGGYEQNPRVDLSSVVSLTSDPAPWSVQSLEQTVEQLAPELPVVLVNFDLPGVSTKDQIDAAARFHDKYPHFAADCLLKPSAGEFVDVEEILDIASLLSGFDVVGVTEQELGPNTRSRLATIARLRRSLDERGVGCPIHIFGSLDPILSALYLMAGADIFDGLTWLRFAMTKVPIHPDTYAALNYGLGDDPIERRLRMLGENLAALAGLEARMRLYRQEGDVEILGLDDSLVREVTAVLQAA